MEPMGHSSSCFGLQFSIINLIELFVFKQEAAYEITYGDWSSDVCSSDLGIEQEAFARAEAGGGGDVSAASDGAGGRGRGGVAEGIHAVNTFVAPATQSD